MNLAQLTSTVLMLRAEEGEIRYDEVIEDPISTGDLADLWLDVSEWKTAANQLERIINDELSKRLEAEDKTYQVGEWVVFRGYRSTSEKCRDPEMFHDWLTDAGWEMVRKLFNPNSARVGSLPPDVRERLFEKTRPPKAEREAVAAPAQVLEDARQRKSVTPD